MPPELKAGPILVTGAGGKTGRAVVAKLLERGLAVRALVRRAAQGRAFEALGAVEVAEGDLTAAPDVARAVRGAAAVYHICPNVHPDEVAIGGGVIEAARRAGARRLAFHSVLHPQIEAMPHHWAKLRVEERLLASGLEFTILRPAPYFQNLLGSWSSIAERGLLPVPYALDSRIAMVDLDDVAEAAAGVLTGARHTGASYDLCGPQLLDQRQIAGVLGEALGRQVRAAAVDRREWAERAAAAGLGRYAIETLLAMFRYYERFGMSGSPATLEWLLGRAPATLRQWAGRIVAGEAGGGGRRPG